MHSGSGFLEHLVLNFGEEMLQGLSQTVHFELRLFVIEPGDTPDFLSFNVLRAQLQTDGDSLQLPVVKLPARSVVRLIIELNSDSCALQSFIEFLSVAQNVLLFLFERNWHNDDLHRRYSGR